MSLNGKVAIVTGSGRGLGLAYAAELARQGASVVVNDVDAETAASAVASIEAEGGTAVAVVARSAPPRPPRPSSTPPSRTSDASTSSSRTPAFCATPCCGR